LSNASAGGARAAYVYSDQLARHSYGDAHPMKPIRLQYTFELARAAGFLNGGDIQVIAPRPATLEELALFHDPEYIAQVKSIGEGRFTGEEIAYGFGPGDNPAYPGMFEAHSLASGGTMLAAELVASGRFQVAFNPAGGLHHALPRRASGFCVFNDPVLAIRKLVAQGMRVVYVDIDCHHGDGVQHGFYDSDQVMTISVHESGRFLFPGTGDVTEIGVGRGEGYSINLPLAPYTDDLIYAASFDAIVPPLIRAFKPDVLFTQLGIDTHMGDPITHMRLSTQGFTDTVAKLAQLGGECGRWIATGGGGYDMSAVARGWAMAFAVMAGKQIPSRLPESYRGPDGPRTFADAPDMPLNPDIRREVQAFADRSVEDLRKLTFRRFGL